ncbi:YrhA family protein [Leclercia sp. Marseille-Q4284]|uniref:YrhA family protein n=1 Tax=Leclercia sp. Marseille-Q4284 TaxID=2866582 RepID=UPI001CE4B634|nr:YrhA family protein [Leclercia sp. Marseille-Q4284]
MENETKEILIELKMMLDKLNYPVEKPLEFSFIESITKENHSAKLQPVISSVCNELYQLCNNQPDYLNFLKTMDGFECNGLILFSLSIPEPLVKNLFVMNDFYRNNDDFINPDLMKNLVIGNDSISLFTYNSISNLFEIRDNVATENIFGSFDNFNDFLREILGTVK